MSVDDLREDYPIAGKSKKVGKSPWESAQVVVRGIA